MVDGCQHKGFSLTDTLGNANDVTVHLCMPSLELAKAEMQGPTFSPPSEQWYNRQPPNTFYNKISDGCWQYHRSTSDVVVVQICWHPPTKG